MNRAYSRSRIKNPQAFNPLSLFSAGEQGAWFDPADLTTLFQDSAGTTPVTSAGQPVGLMRDKSGRNNHASQATAGSRPILRNSGALWWLEFDGVDDFLATASVDFTATDKLTLFTGITKLTDVVVGAIVGLGSNVVLNSFELVAPNIGSSTDAQFRMSGTGSATRRTLSAPISTPLVMTAIGDLAGITVSDEVNLRVNGVLSATAAGGSVSTGNLGNAPIYMGRRGGTTLPFTGYVYGIIVRGALSSPSEITSTEAYLASRSGISF